jgi:hypothetical protein
MDKVELNFSIFFLPSDGNTKNQKLVSRALNVHERMNELFLLHQEALLRLDLELAVGLPLRRQFAIGVTFL